MELHACRNCQIINQIIGNQIEKFSILSEENVTLHNLLIEARHSLTMLSERLQRVTEALSAEREHNLQLYLEEHIGSRKRKIQDCSSEPITDKTSKVCIGCKKQETDALQSIEYRNLLKVIEELQQKQQETLDMLQKETERHTTLLKKHINQAEEHVSVVLEFNKSLRDDLFIQKKQNVVDREDFLKTVDILIAANEKYIQGIKYDIVTSTSRTADKLTKHTINSMCQQLNERDKLVTTLRKQQNILQAQIDQLQNREKIIKEEHKNLVSKLKMHIKYEQEKQLTLEQQRKFDAEGFRNDIKNIRQEIKKLKEKLHKLSSEQDVRLKCEELLREVDKLSLKIGGVYSNPKTFSS